MKALTKEEKIKDIIKKVELLNLSAYELAKSTNLNESGLNRILKGEIKNPHNTTVDLLYNYLNSTNTVEKEDTNKELKDRVETLEEKVTDLKENFKMIYQQLLFLQNSFIAERNQRNESNVNNKSG